MTVWFDVTCSHCGKRNWINNGDLNDQTIEDVEAFKCWCCNGVQFVSEDVDWVDLEKAYVEDGMMNPT